MDGVLGEFDIFHGFFQFSTLEKNYASSKDHFRARTLDHFADHRVYLHCGDLGCSEIHSLVCDAVSAARGIRGFMRSQRGLGDGKVAGIPDRRIGVGLCRADPFLSVS